MFYKPKHRHTKKYILLLALTLFIISIVSMVLILNTPSKNKNTIITSTETKIPTTVLNSKDPIIQNLVQVASKNSNIKNILTNIESYPKELLELASKKPETVDFVSNYPKHVTSSTSQTLSVEKDYKKGSIPLFLQWDERWGYEKYGDNFIAINGCGPTCLSMVIVGLTGDTSVNPKTVADFSYKNGYLVNGTGSSWTLMSKGAEKLGIKSKELSLTKSAILSTLKKGQPIIASMGPGSFTTQGHFIVLTGVTTDNKIIVNDPDSKIRSEKKWDIDVFMKETKNLWTFSK